MSRPVHRCRIGLSALILLIFATPFGAFADMLPRVTAADIPELSGCAASMRDPRRLWVHNDSGNPARLFAVDPEGRLQRRVDILGAEALDWEDLAGFRWQDQSYLAIADTGDNFALRDEVAVLLLPEPAAGATSVAPTRTIRFRYADGARDVEALAVDAAAGDILLLEKRRPPARLYRLALGGADRQVAQPIAVLPDWWPEPAAPVETIGARRYRGAVSAMDLSADGLRLAMLTATHWLLFTRRPGEAWASALSRQPRIARIPHHADFPTTIFEALCWADDGGLWISGERLPAPLLHIPPADLR